MESLLAVGENDDDPRLRAIVERDGCLSTGDVRGVRPPGLRH